MVTIFVEKEIVENDTIQGGIFELVAVLDMQKISALSENRVSTLLIDEHPMKHWKSWGSGFMHQRIRGNGNNPGDGVTAYFLKIPDRGRNSVQQKSLNAWILRNPEFSAPNEIDSIVQLIEFYNKY